MPKAADESFMEEALALAAKGEGHTRPNPPVGAVVVRGGKVVGRGWHKKCGGPHAEVAAIANATSGAKRRSVSGATLYVTLEPCSKPGRVGACTDAIVATRLPCPWDSPGKNTGVGCHFLLQRMKDRKSTRLNSSHTLASRMPSSA